MAAFFQLLATIVHNFWWLIVVLLILWNGMVYSMYADDKRRAKEKDWRLSEESLLTAAFMGGAIGAVAACMVTRHKTKKKSFADRLFNIALVQMLLFGGLIGLAVIGPA